MLRGMNKILMTAMENVVAIGEELLEHATAIRGPPKQVKSANQVWLLHCVLKW